jgi:FixJ family two-component response regulator
MDRIEYVGPGPDENPLVATGTEKSTVFVIDDDSRVCRALSRLSRISNLRVESFSSPHAFLARLPCPGTGCIVLEVNLPGMRGPDLHARLTAAGVTFPVIFVTGHGDCRTGVEAMKRGAVDFLLKPVDEEALLCAVGKAMLRHAADNARRDALREFSARLSRLSAREREVMDLVIRGWLNKQIAVTLDIAVRTVKVHRSRVMNKMRYGSVAELVRACENAGITPEPS